MTSRVFTVSAFCLFAFLFCASPAAHSDEVADEVGFELIEAEEQIGIAALTETVWQSTVPPFGEYDRIGLHRYRDPANPVRAILFYLPGTNMNGELAITDEQHNLWLYLAARGVAVYTLDYRTHFVPNDPVPLELGFMRGWTIASFVSDAELAIAHIVETETDRPLFVAGFSRGVTYTYVLARLAGVDGIIALDGSFKRYVEQEFDKQAALAKLEKSSRWGSVLSKSRGWESRSELMRRAARDPDGAAMGEFDSIGDELTETLYKAWGSSVLANTPAVSSIDVLARAMLGYDRTFPMIQNIEGQALSAQFDDQSSSLDDHFGQIKIPILTFSATNLGAEHLMNGIYSASKSGATDVSIHVLEDYGHVDVLFGDSAHKDVYEVVFDWITSRATRITVDD